LFLLGFVNGPRLDMTVANVLLLAHAPSGTILLDERNECVLLKGPTEYGWQAEPQEMISLLPLGADVGGVLTHGLLYPLREESLTFGDTRGVSNEATQREVRVSLQQGTLLIVRHFPRL
jgi:thiamine pyrophosphokinase